MTYVPCRSKGGLSGDWDPADRSSRKTARWRQPNRRSGRDPGDLQPYAHTESSPGKPGRKYNPQSPCRLRASLQLCQQRACLRADCPVLHSLEASGRSAGPAGRSVMIWRQVRMALAGLERRGWLHQRSPQSGSVGVSLSLELHRVPSTLGELSRADQIPDSLDVTDADQHWRCMAMAFRYRSQRGQRQCQTGGQGNALRSRTYRGPR